MSKLSFEQLIAERSSQWKVVGTNNGRKVVHHNTFFATNCLQTCIGDIVLVNKGTASKVIHEMTVALCELRGRWIKWFDPLITVSDAFYRISNFRA